MSAERPSLFHQAIQHSFGHSLINLPSFHSLHGCFLFHPFAHFFLVPCQTTCLNPAIEAATVSKSYETIYTTHGHSNVISAYSSIFSDLTYCCKAAVNYKIKRSRKNRSDCCSVGIIDPRRKKKVPGDRGGKTLYPSPRTPHP